MTAIRIMIYTDTKDISLEKDDGTKRVTILQRLLETKRLAFAEFKLDLINRYQDFPQTQKPLKLTDKLLELYQEIWFFGTYQKNVNQEFDEELFGGRENELDDEEVKVLERWMSSGGVLMAGDHSVYAPGGKETDPPETFQCLGRAVGHRVPRAGQLRKWEGPPTILAASSFNTLVLRSAKFNETFDDLQKDPVPQKLILVPLGRDGAPHRLFLGKNLTIDVFPDHKHEGEIVIPGTLDSNWPPFNEKDESKKPRPVFVAHGCDKRYCRSMPVLAVYDGDKLGVGRIVVDSSWHHYLNVNLANLTDDGDDSTLDLLSQFYHNLALYLAPLRLRQEMGREMLKWLTQHPEVKEERGNDPSIVGKVALHYLSKVTTRCEIDELLQVALAGKTKVDDQPLSVQLNDSGVSLLPTIELVVGSIVNRFYRTASEQVNSDVSDLQAMNTDEGIISEGLKDAFRSHRDRLQTIASAAQDYFQDIDADK